MITQVKIVKSRQDYYWYKDLIGSYLFVDLGKNANGCYPLSQCLYNEHIVIKTLPDYGGPLSQMLVLGEDIEPVYLSNETATRLLRKEKAY